MSIEENCFLIPSKMTSKMRDKKIAVISRSKYLAPKASKVMELTLEACNLSKGRRRKGAAPVPRERKE